MCTARCKLKSTFKLFFPLPDLLTQCSLCSNLYCIIKQIVRVWLLHYSHNEASKSNMRLCLFGLSIKKAFTAGVFFNRVRERERVEWKTYVIWEFSSVSLYFLLLQVLLQRDHISLDCVHNNLHPTGNNIWMRSNLEWSSLFMNLYICWWH